MQLVSWTLFYDGISCTLHGQPTENVFLAVVLCCYRLHIGSSTAFSTLPYADPPTYLYLYSTDPLWCPCLHRPLISRWPGQKTFVSTARGQWQERVKQQQQQQSFEVGGKNKLLHFVLLFSSTSFFLTGNNNKGKYRCCLLFITLLHNKYRMYTIHAVVCTVEYW